MTLIEIILVILSVLIFPFVLNELKTRTTTHKIQQLNLRFEGACELHFIQHERSGLIRVFRVPYDWAEDSYYKSRLKDELKSAYINH